MVVIALGGNMSSPMGSPVHTLQWAIRRIAEYQIEIISCSPFYSTKPIGRDGQNDYINAVICVQTPLSAVNLLKSLKQVEKAAGRDITPLRTKGRWGSRPLDLDIIDYKGMVSPNFSICSCTSFIVTNVEEIRQCKLVLPHPRAHLRPFVMRPLKDIAPLWHHPVSGLSARSLWVSLRSSPEGQILNQLL